MKVLHHSDDGLDVEKMVGGFDQRSCEEATGVLVEISRVVQEIEVVRQEIVVDANHAIEVAGSPESGFENQRGLGDQDEWVERKVLT